jgi:hypothetical protein
MYRVSIVVARQLLGRDVFSAAAAGAAWRRPAAALLHRIRIPSEVVCARTKLTQRTAAEFPAAYAEAPDVRNRMSCYENQTNRIQVAKPQAPKPSPAVVNPSRAGLPRSRAATFQYLGSAGLTAIGAATGRHYRFDRPGLGIVVQPADIPSLRAVPSLRRVRWSE